MPAPPRDWLGTFVANEVVALASMSASPIQERGDGGSGGKKAAVGKGKGKGKVVEVIDLVSSDPVVPYEAEEAPIEAMETVVEVVEAVEEGEEESTPTKTQVEEAPASTGRPQRAAKRAPGAFVKAPVPKKVKK